MSYCPPQSTVKNLFSRNKLLEITRYKKKSLPYPSKNLEIIHVINLFLIYSGNQINILIFISLPLNRIKSC